MGDKIERHDLAEHRYAVMNRLLSQIETLDASATDVARSVGLAKAYALLAGTLTADG